MKITKRQLRRIIKEERAALMEQPDVPDVLGSMDTGKFQPRNDMGDAIAKDMQDLLRIVAKAKDKAAEIRNRLEVDVEYGERAGGREADDLGMALQDVWEAFGLDPRDMF